MRNTSSIDYEEIEKFSKIADQWWDPVGKFRSLHQINPHRLRFIKNKITEHFGSWKQNLKILDIGCGGGLVTVPLARLGATLTGIDASENNIRVADIYAKKQELKIRYICTTAEDHHEQYDVVLCLEIIEHVSDPAFFIESVATLIKPGGMIILSTINRTMKAYILAILGAEYLLKWLPIGTHEFSKFVKPSEISHLLVQNNLELRELKGLGYDVLTCNWKLQDNIDVNYFAYAALPIDMSASDQKNVIV